MEKIEQETNSVSYNINSGLMFIEMLNKYYGESSKTKADFFELILKYNEGQISLAETRKRVQSLLQGNGVLLQAFELFLPDNSISSGVENNIPQFSESELLYAQEFIRRIVSYIPNGTIVYKQFLFLLIRHLKGEIDANAVIQEAYYLLSGYPSLYNEFLSFFIPNPQETARMFSYYPSLIPSYPSPPMYASYPPSTPSVSVVSTSIPRTRDTPSFPPTHTAELPELALNETLFTQIRQEGGERTYRFFLHACHLLAEEVLSLAEYLELVQSLYPDQPSIWGAVEDLLKQHGIPARFITKDPLPLLPEQVKKLQRCTPSYHRLPSEYLHRGGSQRSYQESRLLNDSWISCPIGSEDFNAGISHRNSYAEVLFQVEDDRFEADVLIETNRHCICKLEALWKECQEKGEGFGMMETALSPLDKRAIRILYSPYEVDGLVMKMMMEMPMVVIPRILNRLKAKEVEWIQEKCKLEQTWRQIQQENYVKSLDVQSQAFKAQDKKASNGKVFLDSIQTIAATRVADYPPSQYILAKQRGFDSLEHHLVFSMPHRTIHKAVVKLLLAGSKRNLPYSDMKRFKTLLVYLVCKLFGLEEGFVEECETNNAIFYQNHAFIDHSLEADNPEIQTNLVFTLFCNSAIYVFFRFYELLYSRLAKIARLCDEASRHLNEFQHTHTVKREAHVDLEVSSVSSSERFAVLINHIILLIRSEEDTMDFEDMCRQLVGARGYIIYTADKVISTFFKHIHTLFNEPTNNDIIASFVLYEEKKETVHLLQYRSHVLRLLLNYRLPLYKLEVQNGEMKMWLVGNSFDIQQTESPMVSPEEFNKVAKDFLSVKVPVKSEREVDLEEEEGKETSEEMEGKKRQGHASKRVHINRRQKEDGEWNDF